ncbi:MAG: Mur ligase family protein [Bacillota bacterium]|nr:Mur ligase family protein [Bacillota bacterium]
MFQIKVKSFLSITVSKLILSLSKIILKGGSNFPGKIALKIDKNVLTSLTEGYKIIVVTGTNGKTTTTSNIYNILKDKGLSVITNSTGANMITGIASCFIENYRFKKGKERYAVIEADEANLTFLNDYVKPEIICITNLFRDQLDRYGEVYTTLKKILKGVEKSENSKLVLNGDESLLGDLSVPNKVYYYGFEAQVSNDNIIDINADAKFCKKCKAPYKYNFITYNHLGDYYCDNCGFKRPKLDYFVNEIREIESDGSLVLINGKEFYINQPGVYNIYNALCAYSAAKLLGIDDDTIFNSLKSQKSKFGRQEDVVVDNKKVRIILVKNPAGYDQAINTISLNREDISIALLLNDNYADGIDVSWIWDVKFESLRNLKIHSLIISGLRLYDMAVRLKISGLDTDKFKIAATYENLLEEIKECETEKVYVLATYTAMLSLRKFLLKKGYIKNIW